MNSFTGSTLASFDFFQNRTPINVQKPLAPKPTLPSPSKDPSVPTMPAIEIDLGNGTAWKPADGSSQFSAKILSDWAKGRINFVKVAK